MKPYLDTAWSSAPHRAWDRKTLTIDARASHVKPIYMKNRLDYSHVLREVSIEQGIRMSYAHTRRFQWITGGPSLATHVRVGAGMCVWGWTRACLFVCSFGSLLVFVCARPTYWHKNANAKRRVFRTQRTWTQALALREASKTQEIITMRFLNANVLPRKSLNCNLSWGFPSGNLLTKTRLLERCVLEHKRDPNARRKRFRNAAF